MNFITSFLVCIILLRPDCFTRKSINLSDYPYPTPNDREGEYTVAIFGTNDIHGTAFAKALIHPITKEEYNYGGVEYLASYVKILRKEWDERFLWLDSGDQFQGGIESKLSNVTIMTDFLNIITVNATAIGNHEFDYRKDYLYNRLEEATFLYLAANVLNETTGKALPLPNTQLIKVYRMGEIKVGVIGLATIETPFTTSGELQDLNLLLIRTL
jgi:2',3'-cyclic-nucleotide 2'-phosphodiesterase (5'-nucleotidase family)